MAKASVREISRITGFSPATVSNALNHKRSVSESTARIIMEAAKSIGYQQSSQLEAINFVLARKNGKIVDDSTFHPSVIEGVEREARHHGMSTSFVTLDFSDREAARPQVEALTSNPSAAIVLLATEFDEDDFRLFDSCAAHMVILDSWSSKHCFDSVVIANKDSSYRAVTYLLERGHHAIGYLAGNFRIKNFQSREHGYQQALADEGIRPNAAWRIEVGTTLEEAYKDMSAWLGRHKKAELPTAFFADNDLIAVGAMRALTEAGLRIPDDISIIGFDDLAVGAFSNPPLTTVHVPKHEVGELAVERLVSSMRAPKRYTCKIQVDTYFVERASVRVLA